MTMAKNQIDFSPDNPENAALIDPKEEEAKVETSDEDLEIAVGPEPEKKSDVVTLTPQEFEALKASGDSAKAVKDGIEGLASRLSVPAPAVAPANAPQETAEEFFEKNSDDIFDKEKGPKLLRKFTKLVSEQEYGGILRGLSTTLANTRKELLEAKDPHFKKYKAEVEALVAGQPQEVQLSPDVYERAWTVVRQRHQSEIEEETVNDKVSKLVDEKLKALGIDPSKVGAGLRPSAHVNSEGRSVPSMSSASKPRVRLPDEATRTALEKEAERKGMDLKDLLRTRGYIQ
jgi:hypothetical protein